MIITITVLMIFVIFILYGWSDAMHYYYKYQENENDNDNDNEKEIFNHEYEVWTLTRMLNIIPIWYIWILLIGFWSILGIIATFFIFPFFHNTMYFSKLNKYTKKIYKKKWLSNMLIQNIYDKEVNIDTFYDKMKYIIIKNNSIIWKHRLLFFIIGVFMFIEMILKLHF